MRSDSKRQAKRAKAFYFRQRLTATREKASRGGNGRGARLKSASHKICEKALIHDLPAFSADWQMPAKTALTAEVEAHFYYEFARESETI